MARKKIEQLNFIGHFLHNMGLRSQFCTYELKDIELFRRKYMLENGIQNPRNSAQFSSFLEKISADSAFFGADFFLLREKGSSELNSTEAAPFRDFQVMYSSDPVLR